MRDLIPPSPPQAHCQAPVSKVGHWARWPRGRFLSRYSLLTCSGGVSPAGPLSARCWVSSRFPALVPPRRCCWRTRAVRCSQEPALCDQELRLLCQELRRRWRGVETGSLTARRPASKEVEFTCGQIRASQARPSAAARPQPLSPDCSLAGSSLPVSSAPASSLGLPCIVPWGA